MPSQLPSFSDGFDFFPKVIATKQFKSKGVLHGEVGKGCRWSVIDPRRHKMQIWQKRSACYVEAARNLNATVVTNGPFFNYAVPTSNSPTVDWINANWMKFKALVAVDWMIDPVTSNVASGYVKGKAVQHEVAKQLPSGLARQMMLPGPTDIMVGQLLALSAEKRKEILKPFNQSQPTGMVLGANVVNRYRSTPNGWHFGRSGDAFSEYKIGKGDPAMREALGGLVMSVDDYKPITGVPPNLYCWWGLVPFNTKSKIYKNTTMKKAIHEYEKKMSLQEAVDRSSGVLFCLCNDGASLDVTMARLGVRYAVRLDGSDSVVYGRGKKLFRGDDMCVYKKIAQKYGIAVFPR